MPEIDNLPYPYFKIDEQFKILSLSKQSKELFGPASNWMELVDGDSRNKAEQKLKQRPRVETELVLRTNHSPISLFNVSVRWMDGQGHMLCIEQDSRIEDLMLLVEKHRNRIAETDFELFEKKEQIEQALTKIKELSSPLISLTPDTGLLSLFGTVDKELIEVNQNRLITRCYDVSYDRILIDFNGVGEFAEDGVDAFQSLIKEFGIMGAQCFITGLKPQHAFHLNNEGQELDVTYSGSLSEAIKQLIK
ncbi:STAS domain-containing protein [Pseudalkalibacillus caeni]|uniref:STAS domain-containing protein n=1 Tax=Exobacillus caeni TaxID=2574798 RepID=A0A5R9F3E9_9BACL|nr:STAS domain-containing protein [Pseudalkalibacillus caeni]TLS34954.1 STAS domain-containing protein [Pseudalkalibacillus caeni]